MKDRISQFPGRVKLTPVAGEANTFDLTRADQPTQEGTPLNKASLLKDTTAALFGKTNAAVPDDILSLLSKSTLAYTEEKYTKTTIGTLAVGKTITLNVGGSPKEFIVVHQGNPSSLYDDSCNGTWLLMKDIYENRVWQSGNINKYESSDIHAYLNNTFLNLFDSNIKDAIKQVNIPYRKNGGSGGTDQSGANGLPAKIFLLSGYEVGWTTSDGSYFPVDGAKLDYFTASSGGNSKRIANINGSAAGWWLRSPYTGNTNHVWLVSSTGVYGGTNASSSYGIRPALILPPTFKVYSDSSGNCYTEQEYEPKITDVLGNLIAIPAGQIKDGVKIAVGSYTGAGTYGASNPNSLTFDFVPKLWGIYAEEWTGGQKKIHFKPNFIKWGVGDISWGQQVEVSLTGNTRDYINISYSENTVSWYNAASAQNQFNANAIYHYFAIG